MITIILHNVIPVIGNQILIYFLQPNEHEKISKNDDRFRLLYNICV